MRKKSFLIFCIAVSILAYLYQTRYLASSRDLNAWTEWTKSPELHAHFQRLGIAIETQSTGSFGEVLSGETGDCRFQVFGADLSGGTANIFTNFMNGQNKIAYYYRGKIYGAPPTRKIMFLSQIDAMAVSVGMLRDIHPMYAIIYDTACSDSQITSITTFGL